MRTAASALLIASAVVLQASAAAVPAFRLERRARTIPASTVQFTANTLTLVGQQLAQNSNHSWEVGTRETALLELNSPSLFLYGKGASIPPPKLTPATAGNASEVFQSVDSVLVTKPAPVPTFFSDGAVGDPASVGIPFLIRNATLVPASPSSNYSIAAISELSYLLSVPRDNVTGAITQRAPPEPIQLWADFVAMAPPFIAYYGAITRNQSLVTLAYDQIAAYRTRLLDPAVNLVQHVVLGGGTGSPPQDAGHWSTGNAWFVQGVLRVLRIIQLSPFSKALATQRQDLTVWALQLTNAAWTFQQPAGFLWNYIDQNPLTQNATTSFEDGAGTALQAANTFRLAQLLYNPLTKSSAYTYSTVVNGKTTSATLVPNVIAAEKARLYIVNHVDNSTGLLGPVVDPENWSVQLPAGSVSPEGEAFVLLLQAAYRDWFALTKGAY